MMLRLREFTPVEAVLTPAQAVALAAMTKGGGSGVVESLTPTAEPGCFRITAGPYIGRILLPDDPRGRQSRGDWALSCGDTRSEMEVRARLSW